MLGVVAEDGALRIRAQEVLEIDVSGPRVDIGQTQNVSFREEGSPYFSPSLCLKIFRLFDPLHHSDACARISPLGSPT